MVAAPLRLIDDDRADRLPPQDIEAERGVLGAVLLQPDLMDHIGDRLPEDALYVRQHQLIWREMVSLHRQGLPADMSRVATALQTNGKLEQAGGKLAIMGLLDGLVGSGGVDLDVNQVLEAWYRRRLGALGRQLQTLQYDRASWTEIYEKAEAGIFDLAETSTQVAGGLRQLGEVMVDVFGEIEQRSLTQEMPGLSTGFYDLDGMTLGGLQPTDLVIVAGRPGMGKSAFALQVGRFVAAHSKKLVAVYSLEMSDKQLAYRLLSSEASISSAQLKTGRGLEQSWEALAQGSDRLSALPMYIDDAFQPSLSHIRSECRKLVARNGELGMVLIDYLQLMDGSGDEHGGNRVQELGKLTRELKMLARELNCPVVVLSQLSRGVEARTNKRPTMSDLRDSGSIEQDADLILMLYREEYYDPDTPDRGIAEVIIPKNRHGANGAVRLLFEPEFTRFRNLKSYA